MRELSSNSVTGPEAVLTAAMRWWLDLRPEVLRRYAMASRTVSAASLRSVRDEDVGTAALGERAVGKVVGRFWQDARAESAVRHMVEQAVRAWKVREGGPGRVDAAREFVRLSMSRELGRAVKADPSFRRVLDERRAAAVSRPRRGVRDGGG